MLQHLSLIEEITDAAKQRFPKSHSVAVTQNGDWWTLRVFASPPISEDDWGEIKTQSGGMPAYDDVVHGASERTLEALFLHVRSLPPAPE